MDGQVRPDFLPPGNIEELKIRLSCLHEFYSHPEIALIGQRLLEEIGLKPYWWYTAPESPISDQQAQTLAGYITRLSLGEPLQYVLGYTTFCGCRIAVDQSVLIPRPETEYLISLLPPLSNGLHILEPCTGSGCISIALASTAAKENLDCHISACDISPSALNTARNNAASNSVEISFFEADIFLPPPSCLTSTKWDIIVSNPPYVRHTEKPLMKARVLDYEPSLALFAPQQDALLPYRALSRWGMDLLSVGGHIYVEINEYLGEETKAVFLQDGYNPVSIHKDLSEKDRYIVAELGTKKTH